MTGFGSPSGSIVFTESFWSSARHAVRFRRRDQPRLKGDVDERDPFGSDGLSVEVSLNGVCPFLHHELETAVRMGVEFRGIDVEECHVVDHRHGAVSGCSVGTPNAHDAGMVPGRDSSVCRCRSRTVDLEHDPCRLDAERYRHEHRPGILARLPGRVRGIPPWNPRSFPLGGEQADRVGGRQRHVKLAGRLQPHPLSPLLLRRSFCERLLTRP